MGGGEKNTKKREVDREKRKRGKIGVLSALSFKNPQIFGDLKIERLSFHL